MARRVLPVIPETLDDSTQTDTPDARSLSGRMAKLAQRYLDDAKALHRAMVILDGDARESAVADAPQKFARALQSRAESNGHAPRSKTGRMRSSRAEVAARLERVRQLLVAQPGITTNEVMAEFGTSRNVVLKYLQKVGARKMHKHVVGSSVPMAWRAKGSAAGTRAVPTRARPKKYTFAERQAQIRAYLTTHPEAITGDVARAIGHSGGSSMMKVLYSVAKPLRAVSGHTPINWVLK